jgi:hypothetical protein
VAVVLVISLVLQPQGLPILEAVEVGRVTAVLLGKQVVLEAQALSSFATQAHLLMLQA